ncbi:unnamed protein product [Sphagnum jensenii]|uniref:non-specific serine/threonine protein kinase n=1 Tax=Sphagnum jensenii TaxID=128206 RepID=A0ABP0X6Z2_9BRYO
MASRATSLSQLRCRIVYEVAKIIVVGLLLSDVVEFAWAQTGFISIDCGSTTPYTDANNISWVPDTTYISTGQNYNAQDVASNESSTLKTLRYFPENQAKNCYVLPVTFNQTYLIRATFLFTKSFLTAAGYNTSSSTTFYYSIDANLISMLEFSTANNASLQDASVLETVLASTSDTFYVCLARSTSTDVPFISSLELRQLYDGMYAGRVYSGYYLDLVNRANWGSSTPVVRYPDDPYDRLWLGATNPTAPAINTSITISTTTGGGPTDRPPGLVLQTAEVWPPGTTGSLSLTDLTPKNNIFYLATYFAEIDPLAQNESRIFDLVLNGKITYANDSVKDKISPGEVVLYAAFEIAGTELVLNSSSTLTFVPHPNSTLGPFLGASEIYENNQVQALTFAPDASAIESIKTQLNLSSYSGDPCVYIPYDWINCTQVISPPRIVSIWLDSNNFTGTIPDLSNLTQLQSLHLENNALDGNLPAWIGSLPVLTELNVTNNNLTGEIPATIQNNSKLHFQYVGNLLCNGTICSISPSPSPNHNSNNVGVIVGATVGGLLVVVAIIVLVVFRSYKKQQNHEDKERLTEGTALPPGSNFSLAELEIATDNYKQLLGRGGFGEVFYGQLPSGKEVAVKKLVSGSQQGAEEFFNEVNLLSRIRHKNLVSLVGFCQEGEEKILVYEFMKFGTLREHLYGTEKAICEPMSWKTRLSIALDAAQGLEYLHEGCIHPIIHRDVKSSNILLSSKLVGKMADFGLSKLTTVEGASHVSTIVKGTAGYLDPEYYMSQQLTEKSDVFSFGIVLLEIICGRQPINTALQDRNQWNIGEWAKPHLEADDIHSVIDKALDNKFNKESVWKVAQLAMMSIDPHGVNRPSMRQVVRNLRDAIAMEEENSIPPTNSTRSNLSHPHASQSSIFLVRATFEYQNYDGLNDPPMFQVALGPTNLSTVDLTANDPWVVEVIYNATETQAFCLIRQMGTPVISSLEVRPLLDATYANAQASSTTMLRTLYRINCGASATLRYPDDQFDRIWANDEYFSPLTASANSSPYTISTAQVHDQAPSSVLSTARINNQNESLTYALQLPTDVAVDNNLLSLTFNSYFSELFGRTGPSFQLSVNGEQVGSQINLLPLTAIEIPNTELSQGMWWNLTLEPVSGAPQINALEVFEPIKMEPSTSPIDVSALGGLQLHWSMYIQLDWVRYSDPCFPVPWEAISCTGNEVTSLGIPESFRKMGFSLHLLSAKILHLVCLKSHTRDLSNMSLPGSILGLWAGFSNLKTLNLSNNDLAGSITDLSDLTSLEYLDLSNNQLSGTLDPLSSLNNLKYLNIMNNKFSGSIPSQLQHPGLQLIDSGNPCMNSSSTEMCEISATPSPFPATNGFVAGKTHPSKAVGVIAGAIGGVVGVLAIILLLVFIFYHHRRHNEHKPSSSSSAVPIKGEDAEYPGPLVTQFSLKELELATNHFKELIGQGSFGPVFLGRLYNGSEVAIKRRSDTSQVGTDSFLNEVNLLSQVHHPNLVQLIGYYTSSEKKNPVQMLVYEYMSGGTLMDHLYGHMTGEGILEWRDRLSLTVGAATGLEYLHNGSDPKIIHRDVKSSNILISSENVAKVSDFGLSKLIADLDKTHVTTAVKGTAGYLDPEYFTSQQLTEKSDVYSFGVVLMEILFAREPISGNYGPEAYNLTAWARPILQQMIPKGDYSMLDPSLESHFNPKSLEIVTSLAVRCTHQHGMKRPTMAEVLRELKLALAIEEGGASFEMPSFKQSPKISEDMHFTAPTPR